MGCSLLGVVAVGLRSRPAHECRRTARERGSVCHGCGYRSTRARRTPVATGGARGAAEPDEDDHDTEGRGRETGAEQWSSALALAPQPGARRVGGGEEDGHLVAHLQALAV